MRFLNSVAVEKCKRGAFVIFWHPLCCKISKQTKGRPFGGIQKSRIFPKKNQSEKHQRGPMFSRFWTSMFLFWTRFWRFEYVLDVRSSSWWCWTNEQKSGPIALNWRKKLATVRVVHFLWKRRLKITKTPLVFIRTNEIEFTDSVIHNDNNKTGTLDPRLTLTNSEHSVSANSKRTSWFVW